MSEQLIGLIRDWSDALTPDAARSLIRAYRESEWRSARLEVIQALGRFQDSRSFQFLVEIIENNQDLAEQELAVRSIGQRRNRMAQAYLKEFYLRAPDTLRAPLAYASGQAQVFSLSPRLLQDFDQALAKQDFIWLKNLILALGELKEFLARPRLKRLLSPELKTEPDLLLAALFALGRLEREAENLKGVELRFYGDPLLHQVFQSSLSQIQIRSQFKLEDYLSKIFDSENPHAVLPLELKAFDEADVSLGISLFPPEKYWERYLFALRGLGLELKRELAVLAFEAAPDQLRYFEILATQVEDTPEIYEAIAKLAKLDSFTLETRLKFCEAFSAEIDFTAEAKVFLSAAHQGQYGISFLNLWSEAAFPKTKSEVKKELHALVTQLKLNEACLARLIRASVELGVASKELSDTWLEHFQTPALRSSLLLYAERFELSQGLKGIAQLGKADLEALGPRILSYLEIKGEASEIEKILPLFENHLNFELLAGSLRVLRRVPLPKLEKFAIEKTTHPNPVVEINAVIALKSYPASREASDSLIAKLESPSASLRGRALDSLCAHTTLLSKRAVIDYLKQHLHEEETVDKIYRSFDPSGKGGEEYAQALSQILADNPDHPQWEKLVSLRDRLSTAGQKETVMSMNTSPELEAIDTRLKAAIPKFERLDLTTKLALRAAEQPFLQVGEGENLPIDKAPTVLEYCKALDLILERHLGQKFLFPKLDRELHDFQTLWHRVGFNEDYPQADRVMTLLGLKSKITPENFPLHKAKMMCGTFFNGKILQDRFKIFDGLRAWAVIFLVFSRKIVLTTGPVGPLLKLPNISDETCINVAKRLMVLQDLRNPAAHRQTYNDLSSVKVVRNESIELINILMELVD